MLRFCIRSMHFDRKRWGKKYGNKTEKRTWIFWTQVCNDFYDKWPSCSSKKFNRQFTVHSNTLSLNQYLLCQNRTWQWLWPYVHFLPTSSTSFFKPNTNQHDLSIVHLSESLVWQNCLMMSLVFQQRDPGEPLPRIRPRGHIVIESQNHITNH